MDKLVEAAQNVGQMLVDLQDDDIRLLKDAPGDACGAGEVEVAVPVHGRDAHHGHVHRQEVTVVGHHVAEDHRDVVAQIPVAEFPLVSGAVPGVVEKVLPAGVALHHLNGTEKQVAPDFHAGQLVPALGQGSVQKGRKADVGGVVHPIPAFHCLDRLVRGAQFLPV